MEQAIDIQAVVNALEPLLNERRCAWRPVRGGLAIEFSDGYDALFVTPKHLPDLPIRDGIDETVCAILEEYARLDDGRRRVLLGIRHCAVEQGVALQRASDGAWEVQKDGVYGVILLGRSLTRLVRAHGPSHALQKVVEDVYYIKTPNQEEAEQLTSHSEPPARELEWKDLGADDIAEPASEILAADRARSRFFSGLDTILAQQGFYCDDYVAKGGCWYGKNHREGWVAAGEGLTRILRGNNELDVLEAWLKEQVFLDPMPSRVALSQALDGDPEECPERSLPISPPGQGPAVPEIASLDIQWLDGKANDLLESVKLCAKEMRRLPDRIHPLWLWGDRLWYRPGADWWVDESWWLDMARSWWRTNQDQSAALILLLNGDDEPREEILQQLQSAEYYNEERFEDGLIWFFRDQLRWPMDHDVDMPEYPRILGTPPPDESRLLALRFRRMLEEESESSDENPTTFDQFEYSLKAAARLDNDIAAEWLAVEEIEKTHQVCLDWARITDRFMDLRETTALEVAVSFGWNDVAAALEGNPSLVPALLDWEFSPANVAEYAQLLSLLGPSELAARLAAYVITPNVRKLKSAPGQNLTKHDKNQMREQQMAAAVAWMRCREAGIGS